MRDWAASEIEKHGLIDGAGPTLSPEAFHGPLGKIVREVIPETEADEAAVLATLVAAFGSAIPGPYVRISATDHAARIFVAIVGDTSDGAKGESWATVEGVMKMGAPTWLRDCVQGGFASGEALIGNLARGDGPPNRLILEREFAVVTSRSQRDASILSPTIRAAWDGTPLENRKAASTHVATKHHLGVVAHVTPDELVRVLRAAEVANGFGNRFLYVASRRTKLLPFGGDLPTDRLRDLGEALRVAIDSAKGVGEVRFSREAAPLWSDFVMSEQRALGVVGALTARRRPQTLRLALTYAAADGSFFIEPPHLAAAIALWRYSDASVRHIFGTGTGDPLADRLLLLLVAAGDEGLSTTEQRAGLGHNYPAPKLTLIGDILVSMGLAVREKRETGGRPADFLCRITQAVNPSRDEYESAGITQV